MRNLECGSLEAVSKLVWNGPSALDCFLRYFPWALPQAGIERAFGAFKTCYDSNLSAKGAINNSPGRSPGIWNKQKRKGLKARSIIGFETVSNLPHSKSVIEAFLNAAG